MGYYYYYYYYYYDLITLLDNNYRSVSNRPPYYYYYYYYHHYYCHPRSCDFVLVNSSNLGPISHSLGDMVNNWLKIANFPHPSFT